MKHILLVLSCTTVALLSCDTGNYHKSISSVTEFIPVPVKPTSPLGPGATRQIVAAGGSYDKEEIVGEQTYIRSEAINITLDNRTSELDMHQIFYTGDYVLSGTKHWVHPEIHKERARHAGSPLCNGQPYSSGCTGQLPPTIETHEVYRETCKNVYMQLHINMEYTLAERIITKGKKSMMPRPG